MKNHTAPIRVLLVDDHEHVLWGLNKLIEGEKPNMTVAGVARSLPEALAAVRERKPHVVVLDAWLGVENTLGHIPAIRAEGAAVLVLTSARDSELDRSAAEQGAHCVVRKDEPAEALLRAIEKACAGRRKGGAS